MGSSDRHTEATSPTEAAGLSLPREDKIDDIIDKYRPSAAKRTRRHDLEILESLRRIVRAIDIHSRSLNVQYHITTPQLICLLTLAERGPMTGTLIAQRMYMSPSTANGIISRLESKGLVRRSREAKDRRTVRVDLTPKGHRMLARAPSPLQQQLVEALAAMPEAEQATINASLSRIVAMMEARDIDAAPVLDTGDLSR
jgi:DNA-binding MarR family transcriptional regulator